MVSRRRGAVLPPPNSPHGSLDVMVRTWPLLQGCQIQYEFLINMSIWDFLILKHYLLLTGNSKVSGVLYFIG